MSSRIRKDAKIEKVDGNVTISGDAVVILTLIGMALRCLSNKMGSTTDELMGTLREALEETADDEITFQ